MAFLILLNAWEAHALFGQRPFLALPNGAIALFLLVLLVVTGLEGGEINDKGHPGLVRVPELSGAEVQRDYYIRFVCPRCFRSRWVLKRNLALTLEQVSNTFWQFECPVHGPLCEKPFEASEKNR